MFKLLNILKEKYHLAVDYINHSKKIEDEILYAQIFNDTIKGSSWLLPDTSFLFQEVPATILLRIFYTEF